MKVVTTIDVEQYGNDTVPAGARISRDILCFLRREKRFSSSQPSPVVLYRHTKMASAPGEMRIVIFYTDFDQFVLFKLSN